MTEYRISGILLLANATEEIPSNKGRETNGEVMMLKYLLSATVVAAMFGGFGWDVIVRPVTAATPAQQQTEKWMATTAENAVRAKFKPSSVVVRRVNLANLNVEGTWTRKLASGKTDTYGFVVGFKLNVQRQLEVSTIRDWKM